MAAVSKERLYQRLNTDRTEVIIGWLADKFETCCNRDVHSMQNGVEFVAWRRSMNIIPNATVTSPTQTCDVVMNVCYYYLQSTVSLYSDPVDRVVTLSEAAVMLTFLISRTI